MKINKIFAIIPFLTALQVFGASVSADDAGNAVRAWVKRGNTLGASLSSAIEKVSLLTTTNGATFYAVKTLGGGTVFTSGNDESEPILAFTSEEKTDFGQMDKRSPLWALLNRDVSLMSAGSTVLKSRSVMASVATAVASANESKAKAKWRTLLEEAAAESASEMAGATLFSSMVLSSSAASGLLGDVRVSPIVKTKWSQLTHNDSDNGEKCYNYYTPNNLYSGCGATAMAQIMKALEYPKSIATNIESTYYMEEDTEEGTTVITSHTGTLMGGTYEWDKMTLEPKTDSSLSEENRQAIGKIMADAGIAANSEYTPTGTASWDCTVRNAFANVFNFKNATLYTDQNMNCFSGSPNHIRTNATARMMWSNFDAGIPVFVAVPGHAIVADGYGFNEGVDYTHFNLGWSGQSDLWYNIPDLSSADSDFTDVNSVVYNLFTKEGESAATAVLSGRAVRNSSAVSGAKVRIYRTGTTELVKEAVANAYGVFGVTVPSGNYDIEVEASDGSSAGAVYNIKASAPQTDTVYFNTDLIIDGSVIIVPTENVVRVSRVSTTATLANIGNSWGNEVDLSSVAASDALAKAEIGSEVKYYNSLDMLFRECRNGATITLLKDCSSEQFCNITNIVITNASYKIVSAGVKKTIYPGDKIRFDIKKHGSLTLENIRFEGYNGERLFNVAGGSLTLNSGAELAELNAKDYNYAAIMIQEQGVFTMNSGSLIEKCEAFRGGAIAAVNGEVKLLGGKISSNSASYGAGVYAGNNGSVQISLGGDISFDSNSASEQGSDIYVGTNKGFVTIVNRLTGGKVGIEYLKKRTDEFGNAAGKRACAIASTLTSEDINNSKSRIYNTANPKFIVQLKNISGTNYFAWAGNDSNGPCDELDGVVKIGGKYYASLADGFANLGANSLIEVVKDCDLNSVVTFTNKNASEIMLQSPSSSEKTITRTSKGGRIVIEGAKVAFSNITICDQLPVGSAGGRLVEVNGGGTLSLRGGSLIKDVVCSTDRSASAVYVNGATIKMSSNAKIENCTNNYYNVMSTPGKTAAAIMVENGGSAIFAGGTIFSCATKYGSAVVINNTSTVSVQGAFAITDSFETDSGNSAGLYVADLSGLSLTGEYTGSVGYTEGVQANTNIFGKAANWSSVMTKASLSSSASKFYHDKDGATGVAVAAAGSSDALLVWSTAMKSGGIFTDEDGQSYNLVTDKTIVDVPVPATTNFEYAAGVTRTVLTAVTGYTLTGNTAEAIGDYVAVATLSDGYIWSDGTSEAKSWAWRIYDPNAEPDPPEPTYETVVCRDFTFTAIERDGDGNWLLTIQPATAYCKYELYTSDKLPEIGTLVETIEVMQESDIGSDGSYTFGPIASGTSKRFWKVKGYDGQKEVTAE